MRERLLYATNNPGKLSEVRKVLSLERLEVLSPADVGIRADVEEVGQTLEENAALKARVYSTLAPEMVVIADDTGLEIEALGGEPGIHVRRWRDRKTRMEDEEIIEYCLARLKGARDRKAQFRAVLALAVDNRLVEFFDGVLEGEILEQPAPFRIEGYPFESLFYVLEWNRLLGEVYYLPAQEKGAFPSHRVKSVGKALPRIKELLRG